MEILLPCEDGLFGWFKYSGSIFGEDDLAIRATKGGDPDHLVSEDGEYVTLEHLARQMGG